METRHILKSLALASKPQVLKNWPVLGSRTALFFELLKFCGALEKFFGKRLFVEIAWKIFVKTFFFFWRALALVSLVLGLGLEHSCPWPRAFPSLASRVSVLGKAVLGLGLGFFLCPWPRALCPQLHLWWKQLRHFSWLRSGGLKTPDFLDIARAVCMQRQKTAELPTQNVWVQLKLGVVKSKDSSTVWYGTPQLLLRSTVR